MAKSCESPQSARHVLRFAPNRVWRCYTGGQLLEAFVGQADPRDGHLPEEWLASTTRALNGENSQGPKEGLSRIRNADGTPGSLLADVIAADPEGFLGAGASPASPDLGVLCKFLDSSVRLPIQCHPDRGFARAHYNSAHGKTESWIILGGRTLHGIPPYLLMGFKPGVEKAAFQRAVEAQDIPAMESMLHRVEVRRGDVWFIPGRLPHAIGPGVFMLEVQEPSDWVIQPERYCADTRLSDADMWGPLSPATAMDCFTYGGESLEEVRRRLLLRPRVAQEQPAGRIEAIIDPGSPWQNGFVESFHGRLRDEHLNREQFWTRTKARVVIEDYRLEYNHFRSHSKLGYLSPTRFAEQRSPSPSTVGLRPPSDGDGQNQTQTPTSNTASD